MKAKIFKPLSRLRTDRLPNFWNNRELKRLKDKYRGRRAFLIGNGPSLKVEDLNLLKGEITFASNRIFLAFDQTKWRPTVYTVADEIVAKNNREHLRRLEIGSHHVFNSAVLPNVGAKSGLIYVNPSTSAGEETFDAVAGFRAGHSVINFDLKLAFYMGLREIYVIGVDHSFEDQSVRTGKIVAGNEVIVSTGENNHFHPDYRKAGETWTVPKVDVIAKEFAETTDLFQTNGGAVYNASRRTKLEVWPKVDFDSLF